MYGSGCFGALREPVLGALGINMINVFARVVRAEDFFVAAGLGGVFGVGQDNAKVRFVLASYSLQSDF